MMQLTRQLLKMTAEELGKASEARGVTRWLNGDFRLTDTHLDKSEKHITKKNKTWKF